MKSCIQFTVVTSTTPPVLTKHIALSDGKLVKTAAAQMCAGPSKLHTCADLQEFGRLLGTLTSAQALMFGVAPGHPEGTIRSSERLGPGDIARTKAFFEFAKAPGVMMLDHDTTADGVSIDADTLRNRLIEAVPELADAPMLWRPSASSCIAMADTDEILVGIKGQRLYIAVQDASLIPEAGKALVDRLWAAGMGWVEVGKAGQALMRTLVDASIWQATRLDFAGPPVLGDGLIRVVPESRIFGDPAAQFDLRLIKCDASITRKADAARRATKAEAKDALREARSAYIEAEAPALSSRRSISLDAAKAILSSASQRRILDVDFELLTQGGETVTVGELLANPEKWHGQNLADPLEPDYGGGNRTVARAYLRSGREPCIRSFAHGGRQFNLRRKCHRIRVALGERARIVDEILDALRQEGDVYEFGQGESLARIAGTTAVPVSREWLVNKIDRSCGFFRAKPGVDGQVVESPQDFQVALAGVIMAKHGERRLPRLEAVVTAPTLRSDGTVLDRPGYDASSGILFIGDHDGAQVPESPSVEQCLQALQRLWAPLEQFPFVGPEDRGVALAALLTAVLRGSLPTAPGFAFDAPSAGSGKTLLARVVGILATGSEPSMASPAADEQEVRKRLFASLREGTRVLLWDNLRDPLGGATIDAFLTAPTFTDRVLGSSQTERLPNRSLFIATGNNVRLKGDTYRRVLTSRIDAKSETPHAREFRFDPADTVGRQRQQLVVDALTIVRGHIAAGSPRLGKGSTASFEAWDRFVRQPVIWIAAQAETAGGMQTFDDPTKVIERQLDADPETEKLAAFLTAWHGQFGNTPTRVAKAIEGATMRCALLHEALVDIAGEKGHLNSRMLGRWIERNQGRRHKGLRIEPGRLRDGNKTWIVEADKTVAGASAETH